MRAVVSRGVRFGGGVLLAVAMMCVAFQDIRGQGRAETDRSLMYLRGQSVIPNYEGWHPNPDGTIDIWFGYLNQNWQEELDLPIGPNNSIDAAPYGPDAGQPTHFLPRSNHWQFAIRVPKDFGAKEIVWTLTSRGKTYRAYATLKPGYMHDDNGLQREFFGDPVPGNQPPVLTVEGDTQRTVKVGEPITLTAVATDDGLPRGRAIVQTAGGAAQPGSGSGGIGGDSVRGVARGLRLAWYIYRGTKTVTFDPPQFKVWEDQRGGSPWAPTWVNPPIPPGNTWVVRTTFRESGTFVLRCLVTDGLFVRMENVTVTVTS